MTSDTRAAAKSAYGLSKRLDLPYHRAVEQITAALKDEGFGVLTEIDVKSTLREKIGAEFRRYLILGACNPQLAHSALETDLEIGLLLPCNVIVYEAETGSVVSIADPRAMMTLAANPTLTAVADEARARLERALAAIG